MPWLKQTLQKPLFPELLWARPQNKRQAGKILIIGGSKQNFSLVGESFNEVSSAGAGSIRIVLPNSLQKAIGNFFPEAIFVPSTPSGSLSSSSLGELIAESTWADGVLLPGNLGNNSETAITIEKYISEYSGLIVMAGDSVELLAHSIISLLLRENIVLVLSFTQLQHLMVSSKQPVAITSSLDLMQIVSILQDFTRRHPLKIVTLCSGSIVVATGGKVSTTRVDDKKITVTALAAFSTVWALQNPAKFFEALSSAALAILEK